MSVNPWKTLGSRIVYRNPWITLREDQVITPTGTEGIYSVVEARTAVGIIALHDDGTITLVGQYRYPTEMYSWEIPEGGGEDGETPLDAAKRELKEETGIEAANWSPLGDEVHMCNCISTERAHLFLATNVIIGEQSPDETEKLAIRRVSLQEAVALVESGEIKDGLSIIAILRASRMMR